MDKSPICGENTRVKLMPDTELKHFPLFLQKVQNRMYHKRNAIQDGGSRKEDDNP